MQLGNLIQGPKNGFSVFEAKEPNDSGQMVVVGFVVVGPNGQSGIMKYDAAIAEYENLSDDHSRNNQKPRLR